MQLQHKIYAEITGRLLRTFWVHGWTVDIVDLYLPPCQLISVRQRLKATGGAN